MSGVSTAVRTVVGLRSGGRCEVCGGGKAIEIHHRRPRGMGGSTDAEANLPSNLLHLCWVCHRDMIEVHREDALRAGWLVPQGTAPSTVPVMRRLRWVRLETDGGITDLEGAPDRTGRDGSG